MDNPLPSQFNQMVQELATVVKTLTVQQATLDLLMEDYARRAVADAAREQATWLQP